VGGPPGPRSALIVEVPAAEPAVARRRERLDSSAPLGVPAHITVLYPFLPPGAIGPAVLGDLGRLFAAAGARWVRAAVFPLAGDPEPAGDPAPQA
jgi:hypothetical protein